MVARNGDGPISGGIVHKEVAVPRVVGVEDDAQQAALAPGGDQLLDIQERLRAHRAVHPNYPDTPPLLHDVDAVSLPRRVGEVDRALQSLDEGLEVNGAWPKRRAGCARRG